MLLTLMREMLHTPVLDILHHLKRSNGMTAGELGSAMKMSYMGVKQHCDDLVAKGMLDTFRRARGSGRPEKLYRITQRLDPIFDDGGQSLALNLLAIAKRVYGETAPAKLLYTFFQVKSDDWAAKLAAHDTLEAKAKALARLRSADGCISSVEHHAQTGMLSLVEHHQPLKQIASEHKIVDEFDCGLIERLLGCQVTRTVEETSGSVRITFRLNPR